jgi:hypothetical protein
MTTRGLETLTSGAHQRAYPPVSGTRTFRFYASKRDIYGPDPIDKLFFQ